VYMYTNAVCTGSYIPSFSSLAEEGLQDEKDSLDYKVGSCRPFFIAVPQAVTFFISTRSPSIVTMVRSSGSGRRKGTRG
jgi:hypothetical protein